MRPASFNVLKSLSCSALLRTLFWCSWVVLEAFLAKGLPIFTRKIRELISTRSCCEHSSFFTMTSIALSDVPAYLRNGAFYKSFNLDNQSEIIQVPEGRFKADTSIANVDDFKSLLNTVMYWGVDGLLSVFLDYCCANDPSVWKEAVSAIADSELRSDLLIVSRPTKDQLCMSIVESRTELFMHLCTMDSTVRSEDAALAACRRGQLDYLKVLVERGFPVGRNAFSAAVGYSQLDCVKFVHLHLCKDDDFAGMDVPHLAECAAKSGDAEILQFLLEKFEVECTNSAVFCAASEGHVDCLRVLHAAGALMDELFDDSDVWLDLEVIKFVHEEVGVPLPDSMIEGFACGDDDERLRYGIEHSSAYDAEEVLAGVISADSDVCLKYLLEELHWPIADTIESGQEFEERCTTYLQESGWLPTDA